MPENKDNWVHIGIIDTDFDYFDLLETSILQGRNFNLDVKSDKNSSCIINKRLADDLGIVEVEDHPTIHLFGDNKYQLIGIVDDMQFTSLREPIKPTAYTVRDLGLINILVKVQGGYILDFKEDLAKAWKETTNKWPLEFQFLDENVERIYQSETRALKLFSIFTIVAIFLSCMGIYGLAAFSVNKRIKEIRIRKVFGAHTFEIFKMLSRSYILIVGISFIIGSPVAFILMNYWLRNFVYRIDMNWWTFILPGSVVLFITLFAVSWQTIKVALENPINALRHE